MMDLTADYRTEETTKSPTTATKDETSPVNAYIQKFEAFSKGENVPMNTDDGTNGQQATTSPPNRFSFYNAGKETLSMLNKMAEPAENVAFEEARTPIAAAATVETVKKNKEAVQSTKNEKKSTEKKIHKDSAASPTATTAASSASKKKETMSKVKLAAAKLSSATTKKSPTKVNKPKVIKKEEARVDVYQDNPDSSILTDTMTAAGGMDLSLALDEETYENAMVLVNLSSKYSSHNEPSSPTQAQRVRSPALSDTIQVHPQSKCGGVCTIM
jgi:hypothetical protein